MNIISVPPFAPVLMESTRSIGYSIETAIADIIDNSIAAKATNIDIAFFPINPYISILDDGHGMDQDSLINAMRYGSKNPTATRGTKDLGRFGLGLKTAALSQCKKLTVVTKVGSSLLGAQWDLDLVINTGEWSLKLLDLDDVSELPQVSQLMLLKAGTLVIMQDLDRLILGEKNIELSMGKYMDTVRNHLSLVFHRYISGEKGLKKIKISINNLKVEANDPFLVEKSNQIMEEEVINIEGKKVTVSPFILPHISNLTQLELEQLGGKDGLRKKQGFYIYRNKRLLVSGTWFNMMRQDEMSKLARVRVDIPNSLDYLWTLDIKKSMAIPPEVVKKNLSIVIERLADRSKRTWTYRGKKETNDSNIHMWNRIITRGKGVFYEINRDHLLFDGLENLNKSEKQSLNHLIRQIETNLPLNQLYVDLTNDEQITNTENIMDAEILKMLKHILSGCKDKREKNEMLGRLSISDPFNQHPEVIKRLMQEVN
ncbi:ATP-binding protein [Paenibacillus swuensis]|uniref:ATP-binding protein n=1 Tax=Paenibacillus swuensis TaxID=1178515 RepID=A0A172TEN9_9BACL|nr:ATP-binding protein [Paenibacillus swuensis]ANE45253.1 ATP-binding protein [Paenibacillus swuensis]